MAEESPTVRIWASCKVIWEQGDPGQFLMRSQDGKWSDTIVTEGEGQCVLSLLDGSGIDVDDCQHAFGVLESGLLFAISPSLEHVNDEDKRVRCWAGSELLIPTNFTLVLFQYTNSRSTAVG